MAIFFFTWPKAEHLPTIEQHSWRSLDFVGSFLVVAASVLVTFSFQNAGSDVDQWRQAIFLAPLIVGIFCWAALLLWEWVVERLWRDRVLAAFPMRLLRNRVYVAAMLNTLFLGFPFLMMVYAFPLRLQVVNGQSPLMAGVMLLPMLGGVSIGSLLAGVASREKNRIFETLVLASSLMLLGVGLETTLSDSFVLEAKALGFLPLIGFGFGLSASSSTMAATFESPISEHGESRT